ncbi:hypothetical protein BDV97DRAFT_396095 [Delphinella strobiligena]|nr:hypothetical protein BDV97DRAFT_396095 [Delphinella strobiligena]
MALTKRSNLEMSHLLVNFRHCNGFGMLLTTTPTRTSWRCSTIRSFSSAKQISDVRNNPVNNKHAFRRHLVHSDENDSSITAALKKGRCPIALFRDYATPGKATNDTAAQCLQAFQVELHSLPGPARQAEIEKRSGGQTVLKWLWDKYDDVRDPEDRMLISIMVSLLVAEGREQMAWDWMLNHETGRSDRLPENIRYTWRKFVAYSLVAAKAKDINGSLDEAFKTYFNIIKLTDTNSKPRYCNPLKAVNKFLFKGVTRGT